MSRSLLVKMSTAGLLTLLLGWLGKSIADARHDAALLRREAGELQADVAELDYASRRAQPIYQRHCAGCHGAQLTGDRRRGIPNLADGIWLYGTGELTEIEQTLLYGIRSGHPKARNIADMPAYGRLGRLNQREIHDVVEFIQQLSRQPHDAGAAKRGQQLFLGDANCHDCHETDGYGITDYGAPALTGRGGSWLYGGDRAALYQSIFDGRHGLCPAWIDTLSFTQIRLLAAWLYRRSHAEPIAPPKAVPGLT